MNFKNLILFCIVFFVFTGSFASAQNEPFKDASELTCKIQNFAWNESALDNAISG